MRSEVGQSKALRHDKGVLMWASVKQCYHLADLKLHGNTYTLASTLPELYRLLLFCCPCFRGIFVPSVSARLESLNAHALILTGFSARQHVP